MATRSHRPLHHSAPRHPSGAREIADIAARERLSVTVVLRPRRLPERHPVLRKVRQRDAALPGDRPVLSRAELDELHGADPADLALLRGFADDEKLRMQTAGPGRRHVVLSGDVATLERAFQVDLRLYEHAWGRYRAHRGAIHVPHHLHAVVDAVLGLDEIPIDRRPASASTAGAAVIAPADLARYYRFPPAGAGQGLRVGVLCFGGGFHARDLALFFRTVARQPAPRVRVRSVLGARNAPLALRPLERIVRDLESSGATFGTLQGRHGERLAVAIDTIEATMDVELAGALAGGADVDVVFAPNTARGYFTALHAILEARPGERPAAVSISWGAAEASWPPRSVQAIDGALRLAKDCDVTVCCASGDFGSRCTPPGEGRSPAVSFPASSPHALGCGGTELVMGTRGTITGERAWRRSWMGWEMATGGGESAVFRRPAWQPAELIGAMKGRGVPDVAACADHLPGIHIVVGQRAMAGSGTSAAAPLWAALCTRLSGALDARTGWLNPLLYRPRVRSTFRDIVRGSNDVSDGRMTYYRARAGWNGCCGLGTPVARTLVRALTRSRSGRAPRS